VHFHEPAFSVRGPSLQTRRRLSTRDSAIRFTSNPAPLQIDSTAGRTLSTGTISERIFLSLLKLQAQLSNDSCQNHRLAVSREKLNHKLGEPLHRSGIPNSFEHGNPVIIMIHQNTVPAMAPVPLINSNVGHGQSRNGSMSKPVIRPRTDKRGVDLICDALPFGRLW
jgi:hypothetical protein